MSQGPTLRVERELLRSGAQLVAGVDEVGRGALAGPVSVGIVVIDSDTGTAPSGVRDSKLLRASAREELVPRLKRWARDYAVGHTQPEEIDQLGMTAALRLAALRALSQMHVLPQILLLDGSHDWFTTPDALFEVDPYWEQLVAADGLDRWMSQACLLRVVTRVKADQSCSSVAAASVLAKVQRDARMAQLHQEQPYYGWDENKGYAAPVHVQGLSMRGATAHHRRSWRLPGLAEFDGSARHPSSTLQGVPEGGGS